MMNEDEYRRKYGSLDLSLCRAKNLVVTLNGGGALVREGGDKVFEVRGGLSAKVVDSTGAGGIPSMRALSTASSTAGPSSTPPSSECCSRT